MATMDAQTFPGRVRWSRYIGKSRRKGQLNAGLFFGLNLGAPESAFAYVMRVRATTTLVLTTLSGAGIFIY
jgi:hypothetical protein